MVYGSREYLSGLFKNNNWGNYFKYGDYSLIMIDLRYSLQFYFSVISFITAFLYFLQMNGILSPQLSYHNIWIHEINMCFDIDFPETVFCNTNYFYKVNETTYRSNDTRQYKRKSKDPEKEDWSKGRQRSFVTVEQYGEWGSRIIFTFSGKYIKHIPINYLYLDNDALIENLCSLGVIYITQATNPDGLKIARGYLPFLPQRLQTVLKDANWFNGNFSKRYFKHGFLWGGFL
jgi:hypothetical protein